MPLTIAAAPFIARLVGTSLREVGPDRGSAGDGREHLPDRLQGAAARSAARIVAGFTITLVSLTGYSAMAGAIGGGGLGDLGIRYGDQRFLPEIMLAVVLVLILFVQAVQSLGDGAVKRLSHK